MSHGPTVYIALREDRTSRHNASGFHTFFDLDSLGATRDIALVLSENHDRDEPLYAIQYPVIAILAMDTTNLRTAE